MKKKYLKETKTYLNNFLVVGESLFLCAVTEFRHCSEYLFTAFVKRKHKQTRKKLAKK